MVVRHAPALAAVTLLSLLARAANAEVLIQTTTLTLRDDVTSPINASQRRLSFKSATKRDQPSSRVVPPTPNGPGDPTLVGAFLVVQNADGSGERFQVPLAASGWRRLGTASKPRGFVFKDPSRTAPVGQVVVKADLLSIKGGGDGFAYTLDEARQGRIALRLQLGEMAWCAEAPAKPSGNPPDTAKNDLPGKFAAQPKTPAPVACAADLRFGVTVQNGYGSGAYAVGSTVHVWAAVSPQSQLVTGWTGDSALLTEPDEWHTTLTMPARDVMVAATIVARSVTLAVSQYTGVTGRPKTVRSFVPPGARGLVIFLHGTNGDDDFITKTEAFAVALRAVESGYGVLGTAAEEAVAGDLDGNGLKRWNPALTPGNLDFANLNVLVASLRSAGTIAPTTPLFALGMSNGGVMAVGLGAIGSSAVAATFPELRFGAVVSHCANGRPDAIAVTTTPTAWLVCANDDNAMVDNTAAAANSAAIAARGVPTVFAAHPASPLYDARFMRVPGIDLATSQALAAELRAAGFVRPDGVFALPTDDLVAAVTATPSLLPVFVSSPGGIQRQLLDQVKAMQAEHEMFSDWARRAVAFVEAHTP